IVGQEDAVEVVTGIDSCLALFVVAGPELGLHLAVHAFEGGGGDDAFGGTADAEEDVDVEVGPGGGDGPQHVTVGDEAGAGAGGPDLGDEVGVAVAVEDDGGQVAHVAAEGLRDGFEVLGGGALDVDGAGRVGADRDLVHVDAGPGVEHRVPLAHGDHRHGIAAADRCGGGAVDGV